MTKPILIEGLIFDGSAALQRGALLIENGRVAQRLPEGAPAPVSDALQKIEGGLITPGLFDVHTHLLLPGEIGPMFYEKMLLQESQALRALRGARNASLMLDFGFTTVRDVCTEGAAYADVALRDAINAGYCEGPRIYPSGPGVGITGGYMPSGLTHGVCIPMGCAICDGVDSVRKEIRTQVAQGVSWIKVFADWPCRATEPGAASEVRPTFLADELGALVDEARRRGRRVAAHATSDSGARQAIECGVASIEHMGDLSMETLALAAERGVVLVPTLSVSHFMFDAAKEENKAGAARRYEKVVKAFERALASGVNIACGTDIGCFPFETGSLREIVLMCELGMKPHEALLAATRNAAKLLEKGDLGGLEQGAIADVCVFGGDKLEAAVFQQRPTHVIQNGKLVRGETRITRSQ